MHRRLYCLSVRQVKVLHFFRKSCVTIGGRIWIPRLWISVKKRVSAYVAAGSYASGEPKVKYRGIFINDEWPSFGTWRNNQFGGINHKVYEKIFELLLRLKANYFWPAILVRMILFLRRRLTITA